VSTIVWYQKATKVEMPYAADLPDITEGDPTLVAHTNGGGANLGPWFARPGNHICSHFQVFWNGRIEQYVPLTKEAYAQFSGNAFAWSVEHQDDGNNKTPFTQAQLHAFFTMAHDLGVPFQVSSEQGHGIGWHSLFASWNKSGHDCVGAVREAQLRHVLAGGLTPAKPGTKHNPWPHPGGILMLRSPAMKTTSTKFVQWALGLAQDGVYGTQTAAAVRAFQSRHGLAVDGKVGPATTAALALITH